VGPRAGCAFPEREVGFEVFDVAIIGGGPGGYVAALRAAQLGASVALLEQDLIGGTCLNRGCIPTKALLESARLARLAARGSEFGVRIEGVRPDPPAMAARSRSIVETMRKGVEGLLAARKVKVVAGRAAMESPTAIVVEGEAGGRIDARMIIVATGSSWVTLPGVVVDGETIITSDHALGLGHPDGRMVIVGGGAVGCEVAEIYSALGASITIVEMMDHILPTEDAEIARRLEAALKRKGIAILTSARVAAVERGAAGVEVKLEGGKTLAADRVLVGIGRRPNTEGLGLEQAGVKFDRRGIPTDARLATNVAGIFAVGDVTGKYLLAHVATAQGIVAAENACGMSSEIEYGSVPRCVYTDPEFAAVGMSEAEAAEAGAKPHAYGMRLGRIGRALTMGETFGFAKMICDGPGGRVLGFIALAPHASELVAEVGLAIKHGLSAKSIADVIHPHPTLSEIVWESASGAAGRHIHGDPSAPGRALA
jgi:dihydrolipoamide dehydrogenase